MQFPYLNGLQPTLKTADSNNTIQIAYCKEWLTASKIELGKTKIHI